MVFTDLEKKLMWRTKKGIMVDIDREGSPYQVYWYNQGYLKWSSNKY